MPVQLTFPEGHTAMVSATSDPTCQGDSFAGIRQAKRTGFDGADHVMSLSVANEINEMRSGQDTVACSPVDMVFT